MRKFSEVLEEYLNVRDEVNSPDYYDTPIPLRSGDYFELSKLKEELDSYFKEQS